MKTPELRNDLCRTLIAQAIAATLLCVCWGTSGKAEQAATVSAGGLHTCALTTAGALRCWGWNRYGQLGLPIRYNGKLIFPKPMEVPLGPFLALAAGEDHNCAVRGDSTFVCWGADYFRPTGGDYLVTMVAAGDRHSCALTQAGGVKCWGFNFAGQLGDGTTIDRSTPADVTGLTSGVVAIAAGRGYSCAVTQSGGVKCWGLNAWGQLGDGTTIDRLTPVNVRGLHKGVAAISPGSGSTCALTNAGGVRCWGANEVGELGDGTTEDQHVPVKVKGLSRGVVALSPMSAGSRHTCVVTDDGRVKCWGYNGYGQLGLGNTDNQLVPMVVPRLRNAISVSVGERHTCAVTRLRGIKCWGNNDFGQLGDGSQIERHAPVEVKTF